MMESYTTLYAVVPHLLDVPPLDVLNMPYPLQTRPLDTAHPITVDLVTAWNPDHAAHIEAVTGWAVEARRHPSPIHGYRDVIAFTRGDTCHTWTVGVVAARFHVTGCHKAEAYGPAENLCAGCCDPSPWALYDNGLWHWTGHAEKVRFPDGP